MKKLLYIPFICLIIIMSSCNDMDLYPKQQLGPENFWKTELDIKSGLAGVYSRLTQGHIGANLYSLDNLTDDAYCWATYRGFASIQTGSLEPSTGVVGSIYGDAYRGVAACNNFMKNFPQAVINSKIGENKANIYEAEIRFLRAFFYFELVRFYGDVPLYKKAIESVQASKIKQSPVSEVYKFIAEDMEFAIAHLPDDAYSNGHAVRSSALALKARIAIFQSDWKTVEEVTKSIISTNTYQLSPNYKSIFIKREGQNNNPEIIFSITYLNPDYRHDAEMVYYYQAELGPLDNLMRCYDLSDKRFNEWYVHTGVGKATFTNVFGESASIGDPTLTGWILLKHMDKYNKETYTYSNYDFRTDNDIVIFRYADVYLMYIEAMIEQSGGVTTDALAISSMNEIRTRAGIATVTSISRDELRLERRRELAFEGLRHFDLIRWRAAKDVMNAVITPAGQCSFKEHMYIWPFPQSEMDINPQLEQKNDY